MNRANLIAVPSASFDIPNGSKPNSLPWTTSAWVRLAMSSSGAARPPRRGSCFSRSRRATAVLYSAVMSESFVGFTYRGVALGRRVKLPQVRPSSGYVEHQAPMPVGTSIGIASEDGTLFEATVTQVVEQPGGAEGPPGMTIRPRLDGDAAKKWWQTKVDLPDVVKPEAA